MVAVAAAHLLVVPTRRVQGIESPELLASDIPNYWEYAWNLRGKLEAGQGIQLARDDVAMAVNSAYAMN